MILDVALGIVLGAVLLVVGFLTLAWILDWWRQNHKVIVPFVLSCAFMAWLYYLGSIGNWVAEGLFALLLVGAAIVGVAFFYWRVGAAVMGWLRDRKPRSNNANGGPIEEEWSSQSSGPIGPGTCKKCAGGGTVYRRQDGFLLSRTCPACRGAGQILSADDRGKADSGCVGDYFSPRG
jgi:hypothetical protein